MAENKSVAGVRTPSGVIILLSTCNGYYRVPLVGLVIRGALRGFLLDSLMLKHYLCVIPYVRHICCRLL